MPALQSAIKRNTELGIQGQVTSNLHNRVDRSLSWGGADRSVENLFGRLVEIAAPTTVNVMTPGADKDRFIAGFVINQRQTQNGVGFDSSSFVTSGDSVSVMQTGTLIVKAGEAGINSDPLSPIYVDIDDTSPTVGQLFQATPPAQNFLVSKWVTVVTVPDAVSLLMEINFNFDFRVSKL